MDCQCAGWSLVHSISTIATDFHKGGRYRSGSVLGSLKLVNEVAVLGVRSPLVVDYEETFVRLKKSMVPVSCDGLDSRCVVFTKTQSVEQMDNSRKYICCAFNPKRRSELVKLVRDKQWTFSDALLDPTDIFPSTIDIGVGSYCNAGVIIGSMAMIGEHVLINRGSTIGHHVIIDDLVSIGPSVTIGGGVKIARGAMIGAASVLLPGITVGENALVAAGAVVVSDVLDDTMVAGNPAVAKNHGDVIKGIFVPGEE